MKQTIKLTENELRNMIADIINESMEESEDEGLKKNLQAAWSAFKGNETPNAEGNTFQQTAKTIGNKFKAAKQNFKSQGKWDNLENVRKSVKQLVDAGKIDPEMSVSELIAPMGGIGRMKTDITKNMKANGGQRFEESINAVVNKVINEMINK